MSSAQLAFAIKSVRIHERPVELRLPFKFGSAAVRRTAQAFAAIIVETADGRRATGHSAQLMVPRWFNKAPGLTNEDTVEELRESVAQARQAVRGASNTASAAAHAADCRAGVEAAMTGGGTPRLAAGFGPALLEMALIDAACRLAGLPFDTALNADIFGLTDHCPDDLSQDALLHRLRKARLPRSIFLRHTVGQDAPLYERELGPGAPEDGLPVALETVIASQGVRYFKIKLNGDLDEDVGRLERLSAFLGERCPDYRATLDANEQYDLDAFAGLAARLAGDAALKLFAERMLFVEQPFARDVALGHDGIADLLRRTGLPVIIDESDESLDSFPRALELGYAGTSVKSCKGVFRALINAARADQHRAAGRTAQLSAEDLTCQPGLCIQQDLAMAGVCGATHIERNGHHFVAGMAGAPEEEVAAYLDRHGDLYRPFGDGDATLDIIDGTLSLGSLATPGFGSAVTPQFDPYASQETSE
ncbi:enolase C-terminal domain-like protein [Nitratireductor thuwali]|uniref:O-succinylbenzoate synthase n=1 Tax=Nitratireductor thuwali TaxID=2267699 RepID=A0ABY5MSS9_9HYPH|nr:o-succinylbenzoate synthase [Nitratireductor thuwali]